MVEGSEFLILQYGDEACAPCLTLRIKIKNWLKGHTGIEGRYIPICEYSEIAAQRGILSVPTIEVYAFGKLMIRESGYFSLDQIFEQMERYLRIKGEKYAECKWKRSKIP